MRTRELGELCPSQKKHSCNIILQHQALVTSHTSPSRPKQAGERLNIFKWSPVNYVVSPCLRMCLLLPASPPPVVPPAPQPLPHQWVPGDEDVLGEQSAGASVWGGKEVGAALRRARL